MKKRYILVIVSLLVLLLAACGGDNPSPSPTPTQNPYSSGDASTSSAPASSKDATKVAESLKANGVAIGELFSYTAENDPDHQLGKPHQYISKVVFKDSTIPSDVTGSHLEVRDGGSIEVYATTEDAEKRFEELKNSSETSLTFMEHKYIKGNTILRIARSLSPEQKQAYEDAFQKST